MAEDILALANKANAQVGKISSNVSDAARWFGALGFAIGLLIVIALVTWLIIATSFAGNLQVPAVPSASASPDLAGYTTLVGNYKSLSDVQVNRFSQMFQAIVVSALLPVLTLVLGFIFGKETKDKG